MSHIENNKNSTPLHIICEKDVGIFSLIQQIISHIPWALSENRIPIVLFQDKCCYWTPKGYRGSDNVWEYYFEPIIQNYPASSLDNEIRKKIRENFPSYRHEGHFVNDTIYISNNYGDHPKLNGKTLNIPYQLADASDELRKKANPIVKEYVRPRRYIIKKVEDFYNNNMKGNYIIGLHIRGTDSVSKQERRAYRKGSLNLQRYYYEVLQILENKENAKIFVATDDENLLNHIKTKFGSRVVSYNSIRHIRGNSSAKGPMGDIMPAYIAFDREIASQNGEEAIIDYLLLCRSDILIHNGASLARTVLLTNNSIKHINTHKPHLFKKIVYIVIARIHHDYRHIKKTIRRDTKKIKRYIKKNNKILKNKLTKDIYNTRKYLKRNFNVFIKDIKRLIKYNTQLSKILRKNYKHINKVFRFYKNWVLKDLRWQVNYKARNEFKIYRDIIKEHLKRSFGKSRSRKLIFGKYNKIFVITMNYSNAGFFTYLQYTLNQLDYCEKNNFYPVVSFGEFVGDGGHNAYYDKSYGENMWEYYFEPVSDHNYEQVMDLVNDPANEITTTDLTKFTTEDLKYMHKFNPKSIFTYPYGIYKYKSEYDEKWYKRHRNKAHKLIKKYIRVKDHIIKEVDEFYNKKMDGNNVIGIHIRGTDKGSAKAAPNTMRIIEPDYYVNEIEKYSKDYPNCKILVATDQEQYIEFMKEKYGERIIYYPAIRSRSSLAPFQMKDGNNYQKGKDVLIECLLLSKCQFLLKCTSAVGEAAHWFNPDLKSIDMNYLY